MAVIFACGWECRVNTNGAAMATLDERHWNGVGALAPTISTTTVRTGTAALRNNSTTAQNLNKNIAAGERTIAGRYYLRIATLPSGADNPHISNLLCASGNGVLRITSAGVLQVICGASAAVDGPTLSTGQWYRIDFLFDTSGATASMKVQVDGANETTATNAQAAADITTYRHGTFQNVAVAVDYFYDDLILADTSAEYPLGAGTVDALSPTADGTHSFTAGDFAYDTAGGNVATSATDVFGHIDDNDLTSTADLIRQIVIRTAGYVEVTFPAAPHTWDALGLNVVSSWHAAGTSADTMGMKLVDGGSVKDITNEAGGGLTDVSQTTIIIADKFLATAPSGGAWTAAKIAASKIRAGYSGDVNSVPYWDGVMYEIAYGPAPAVGGIIAQNPTLNRRPYTGR